LIDRIQFSIVDDTTFAANLVTLLALASEFAPPAAHRSWLDALNYFLQCHFFPNSSTVYLLFFARCLCTDLPTTVNVSRLNALIDVINDILRELPDDRTEEGCMAMDLLRVFALHFGPEPDLFPLELELQWSCRGLLSEDDTLFESTARFFCDGCEHIFLRRLFLAMDVIGTMRTRAKDCGFAARGLIARTAIALVRDATASQLTALVRAGATAVVAQGLADEVVRAEAFRALAFLIKSEACRGRKRNVAIEQFTEAGGLELLEAIDVDAEEDRVASEAFIEVYESCDSDDR
jgi:hypothetical protein